MAKVTLTPAKVKAIQYAGQTVVFPVIGEATFNSDGTLDVNEEVVSDLIAATFDSFGFYQKGKEVPGSKAEAKNAEYQELSQQLELLDTKDLLEFARETNLTDKYSAAAIASMTDGKLRQVLLDRLIELNAAGQPVTIADPIAPVVAPVSQDQGVDGDQDFTSAPVENLPGQED